MIKKALITGGGGAIGWNIVCRLAEKGAKNICVHARMLDDDLMERIENLERTHPQTNLHTIEQDLTVPGQCQELVDMAISMMGRLDALVCNAGAIYGAKHFSQLSMEDWEKTMALNLTSPFFLCRHAFTKMQEDGGRIVYISSIAAKYGGGAKSMHYGIAKAGAEAMVRGLAREGSKRNILVNCIRAGFIDTPFHRKIGRDEEQIRKRIEMIPLGRAGTSADVAEAVCFLLDESGSFITGEVLTVAGGD